MTREYEIAGVVRPDIDSSATRRAERDMEAAFDKTADVDVGVDERGLTDRLQRVVGRVTPDISLPSMPSTGASPGGSSVSGPSGGAASASRDPSVPILQEQLAVLEDIEDALDDGIDTGRVQGLVGNVLPAGLVAAAGGLAARGLGAAGRLGPGLAGTAVAGLAMTPGVFDDAEEIPGLFGEGRDIFDVIDRDEPIVDIPALVEDPEWLEELAISGVETFSDAVESLTGWVAAPFDDAVDRVTEWGASAFDDAVGRLTGWVADPFDTAVERLRDWGADALDSTVDRLRGWDPPDISDPELQYPDPPAWVQRILDRLDEDPIGGRVDPAGEIEAARDRFAEGDLDVGRQPEARGNRAQQHQPRRVDFTLRDQVSIDLSGLEEIKRELDRRDRRIVDRIARGLRDI